VIADRGDAGARVIRRQHHDSIGAGLASLARQHANVPRIRGEDTDRHRNSVLHGINSQLHDLLAFDIIKVQKFATPARDKQSVNTGFNQEVDVSS
jgi:hypothetical protein